MHFAGLCCANTAQCTVQKTQNLLTDLDFRHSLAILFNKLFNILKPAGHVMHHQFNIQQMYDLPTIFMCFVFIWEQTATCATYSIKLIGFYNRDEKCLQRGTDWVFK